MAEVQAGTETTNGTAAVASGKTPALVFSAFKPLLLVEAPKANDAVQFYKTAFGAEEINRSLQPKRKAEQDAPLVLSADLKLGSSVFSVADTSEVKTCVSGIEFVLEMEDVDGTIAKAIEAGAVAVGEVTEVEGAGRVGKIKDPYGFTWVISSPAKVSDVEA